MPCSYEDVMRTIRHCGPIDTYRAVSIAAIVLQLCFCLCPSYRHCLMKEASDEYIFDIKQAIQMQKR